MLQPRFSDRPHARFRLGLTRVALESKPAEAGSPWSNTVPKSSKTARCSKCRVFNETKPTLATPNMPPHKELPPIHPARKPPKGAPKSAEARSKAQQGLRKCAAV